VKQGQLLKAQSLRGATPTHNRKSGAAKKRGRFVKACLGIVSVAVLIAGIAVFATIIGGAPSPVVDNTASRGEPSTIATIVLNAGTRDCQQKSFNNQTGEILDQSSPCQNEVVFDRNGVPIPRGTVRTLDSVSKSFKGQQ
jgi:hypothetical protein